MSRIVRMRMVDLQRALHQCDDVSDTQTCTTVTESVSGKSDAGSTRSLGIMSHVEQYPETPMAPDSVGTYPESSSSGLLRTASELNSDVASWLSVMVNVRARVERKRMLMTELTSEEQDVVQSSIRKDVETVRDAANHLGSALPAIRRLIHQREKLVELLDNVDSRPIRHVTDAYRTLLQTVQDHVHCDDTFSKNED